MAVIDGAAARSQTREGSMEHVKQGSGGFYKQA